MEQVKSFEAVDMPRLTKDIAEFLKTKNIKHYSLSHTMVYKPIQMLSSYITTQKQVSAILIYEEE